MDEQYAHELQDQLWTEDSLPAKISADLLSRETTHLVRHVLYIAGYGLHKSNGFCICITLCFNAVTSYW